MTWPSFYIFGPGSIRRIPCPVQSVLIPSLRGCGGTLLGRLLDGHPQCSVLPFEYSHTREAGVLDASDRAIFPYVTGTERAMLCGLHQPQTMAKLTRTLDRLKAQTFLTRMGVALDGPECQDPRRAYRRILAGYFFGLHGGLSSETVVNYAPDAVLLGPEAIRTWQGPDRIIITIRDPRAIYAAFEGRDSSAQVLGRMAITADLEDFCHRFRRLISEWVRPAQSGRWTDVHLVSFESLVRAPEPTMRGIANFLDIEWWDGLLKPTVLGRPLTPSVGRRRRHIVHPETADSWERVLSPDTRHELEARFGELIEELNHVAA